MDSREQLVAAFARRAEQQRETERNAELEPPAHWPHRFCTYQEARGWVTRLWTAGAGERKTIAKERGVSPRSVSRAVRTVVIHLGAYDPAEWSRHNRERNAEGRRRWLAMMKERDLQEQRENQAIASNRDTVAEQRRATELHDEPAWGPPSPPSTHLDTRVRRQTLQRKLNARNRARIS